MQRTGVTGIEESGLIKFWHYVTDALPQVTGSFDLGFFASRLSWEVVYPAPPIASEVRLEGAIGDNPLNGFYQLDVKTGTASELRHIVNKPIRFIRVNFVSSNPNQTIWVFVRAGGV